MMLAILQKLGVVLSFSRPSVSDNNPYSESLFHTLKYVLAYPSKPFESLGTARRQWIPALYGDTTRAPAQRAIRYVTPNQRIVARIRIY